MNVIDFCAGAGGTTAGLRRAGAHVVRAFDNDATALASLTLNHTADAQRVDLAALDPRSLPTHDAQVWTPPCEEVSYASGRTAESASMPLMETMLDVITETLPRYVLFENVPPVTGWRGFGSWRRTLVRLGYWITDNTWNSADYENQERRRYLLLACRGVRAPRPLTPVLRAPKQARAILDLDTEKPGWSFVASAPDGLRRRIGVARTRVGAAFLLDSRTRNPGEVDYAGRSLDRPMPTVTTAANLVVVVGSFYRRVSVREAAAAQGFDRRYRFEGNEVEQRRQIGRAFPVRMAEAAFRALVD